MRRTSWRRLWWLLPLAAAVSQASAADEGITWLRDWPAAQAAARASGKRVFVYIYQNAHSACVEMDNSTFPDPSVVKTVSGLVPMALNGSASANREFCARYSIGVRSNADKGLQMEFGAIPAYLFLDADGKEYFRTYGFYPPVLFVQLLERANSLMRDLPELARRPNDGRLHADIGDTYLNLERADLARPYLERAVKLDPENATGARADAELDLLILAIPEKPGDAIGRLVAYRYNYPETKRDLEIRYYMAVAELASGRLEQSKRILLDFRAIPPKLPNGERNPDYHNHWTELADLLMKQLESLEAGERPKPR